MKKSRISILERLQWAVITLVGGVMVVSGFAIYLGNYQSRLWGFDADMRSKAREIQASLKPSDDMVVWISRNALDLYRSMPPGSRMVLVGYNFEPKEEPSAGVFMSPADDPAQSFDLPPPRLRGGPMLPPGQGPGNFGNGPGNFLPPPAMERPGNKPPRRFPMPEQWSLVFGPVTPPDNQWRFLYQSPGVETLPWETLNKARSGISDITLQDTPYHVLSQELELSVLPPHYAESPGRVKALLLIPSDRLITEQRQLALVLVSVNGLTLLGLIMLLRYLFRRGFAPILDFSHTMQSIHPNALDAAKLDTENVPIELQPIANSFDKLMQRLAQAFAEEKTMTANLAHELRTPLAAMRTSLEVMLMDAEQLTDEHHSAIESQLDILENLQKLIDRLLQLAQLERGDVSTELCPIDLDELVKSLLDQYQTRLSVRQLRIGTELSSCRELYSDPILLEAILRNLLDNAVEYALQGTKIDVSVAEVAGRYRITIRNETDLTETDLPHLSKRFWRKDQSRHDAVRHAGLGLLMVNRCCDVLGAEIAYSISNQAYSVVIEMS